MKQHKVLIILLGLFLAVVSFLVFHLHNEGIHEILRLFQKEQLSYAKNLSNQIQFFIEGRSRGLRALSSFTSFQNGDVKQQTSDIQAYAKQIEKIYVKTISLYNEAGTIVYSTDPNTSSLKKSESPILAWAHKSENRGKVSLTPAFPKSHTLTVIFAIPLYREVLDSKHSKPNEKFAGVLSLTLDIKTFLNNQLGSKDPKLDIDQVWING